MESPDELFDSATRTHDGFFKAVFSQPEHAIAFFKRHLPAELVARIDWDSLKLVPGSFVKSNLRQAHSDLMFSVRIDGLETLLYLLFEHQSTPDPSMPLRLLGYVVEFLNDHYQKHGLPLPPVLPFVFHQGPDSWNVSTDFQDLFALPEDLRETLLEFLPKFRHALLDLTRADLADECGDIPLQAILQLMKFARRKEPLRFFELFARWPAHAFSEMLLRLILFYAMRSDSDLDVETIYRTLSSNPELRESAMSVAEKLEAKGRKVGHKEGRKEGRTEGRKEGRTEGAIQMLEEFLGFPVTSSDSLAGLTLDDLDSRHRDLRREYDARFKRS